jgi:hypothetical protein
MTRATRHRHVLYMRLAVLLRTGPGPRRGASYSQLGEALDCAAEACRHILTRGGGEGVPGAVQQVFYSGHGGCSRGAAQAKQETQGQNGSEAPGHSDSENIE